MRSAILVLVFSIVFTPKAKSQYELVELALYYFLSWDECSMQFETRPSLNNTFYTWSLRGGHTNYNGNFTGGMTFNYSRDNLHGLIDHGKFTNYHVGLYLEKKFRPDPNQRIYFSIPLSATVGETIANDVVNPNPFSTFNTRSTFWMIEPELLLNYGLGNHAQFYFGAGYRFCRGSTTFGLSDELISGPSLQLGFRFGDFTPWEP